MLSQFTFNMHCCATMHTRAPACTRIHTKVITLLSTFYLNILFGTFVSIVCATSGMKKRTQLHHQLYTRKKREKKIHSELKLFDH